MLENTPTPIQSFLFLITRSAILLGMILFFASMGYMLGGFMANYIWDVNLLNDPTRLNDYATDTAVLNTMKLLQVTITIGAMVIPAWIFPKALQQSPTDFLQLNNPFRPIHLLWTFGIILLSVPFVSWLVEWNEAIRLPEKWQYLEQQLKASEDAAAALSKAFTAASSPLQFVVTLFIVAVFPAIAEEFLFRGTLIPFLRMCFRNNIHLAVVLSAILFSAFHGQFYGFLPRMVLGMLIGYLFIYSKSIWPGVLAHFINNAIAISIPYFEVDQSEWQLFNEHYHFPEYAVVLSLSLCVYLVFMMHRTYQKNNGKLDQNI